MEVLEVAPEMSKEETVRLLTAQYDQALMQASEAASSSHVSRVFGKWPMVGMLMRVPAKSNTFGGLTRPSEEHAWASNLEYRRHS